MSPGGGVQYFHAVFPSFVVLQTLDINCLELLTIIILNSYLRELCYFAAIHEFEVRAVHVPGVSNCYADLLSRWDSCDIAGRNLLAHAQHANLHAVPVPDDLFKFDNDF